MFRKFALLTLTMLFAIALSACGSDQSSKSSSDQPKQDKAKTAQTTKDKAQPQPKKGLVDEDKTVATVNDEKIKGKDYNMALQQLESMYQQQGQDINDQKVYEQIKNQAISSLVGNQLILQDADKKGYQPSEKAINDQIDQVKGQFPKEKDFTAALKKNNLTMDQFKKQTANGLKSDEYIKKEVGPIKVSDDEIKSFYKKYSEGQKKAPELAKVEPQIKQQIQQQKTQEKLGKIVDQLKEKNKVKVNI